MKPVTLYSIEQCPFCDLAKTLLRKRGVAFAEIRLPEEDDLAWRDLTARSGMKTVPQIFHGETLIGGFRELAELDQLDGLRSLLSAA